MIRLPPLFGIRPPKGPVSDLFSACVNFALDQTGALTSRVPEMLLVEALQIHGKTHDLSPSWLAATSDQVLNRALQHLHADPSRSWTVAALASEAHTSLSVLDERFKAILRKPPVRYLTELRMQRAADTLARTDEKIARVAQAAGYGSEEAFSRAFKKHVGFAPSAWREKRTTDP